MEIDKSCLKDILNKFDKIIIPDIQRDYVMGSGGKKLVDLLTSMIKSAEKGEKFNFSCIVGYKDKNNCYVYDGQQRLATLIYLCSYLYRECIDNDNFKLLMKFDFTGRNLANKWLENPKEIKKCRSVDFTTYSLSMLIEEFTKKQFSNEYPYYFIPSEKITFEFLFNNVVFDMILVDIKSDAEQFFLDINDGLDLKDYEVFKAELFHHASEILEKEIFKRFALKMENEWLKIFLRYENKEIKHTNEGVVNIIYSEEEVLAYFLKYCFRMIWIEENGNDERYKSTNITWLTKEHFDRLEKILDAMIKEINISDKLDLSCINYSIERCTYPTDYCKGQHWNISDKNYVAILNNFLKNLYNVNETKKDVVIWCYISKLPLVVQNKDTLYEYLRFVKKVLNNNRKPCDKAKMLRGGCTPRYNYIIYTRYYVLGIPQYYTGCKNEQYDNEMFSFLNSIVILNKGVELGKTKVSSYYSEETCKNELLKSILIRERKKQNSQDICAIEKYEDLPFINGLVDNFVTYNEKICHMQEFCTDEFYSKLSNIHHYDMLHQYKDILKFIYENKFDILKSLFLNISILWENYCGTTHKSKGSLTPHSWCDFFTAEKGIPHNESPLIYPIHILPDGWISADMKILQPAATDVYSKNGFAARAETKEVWNISNYLDMLNYVTLNKYTDSYIINGTESDVLPHYLRDYNKNNWVFNYLSKDTAVYFSENPYLNEVLLYMFKTFLERTKEIDVNIYLKQNVDKLRIQEMYGNKFFIKLHGI